MTANNTEKAAEATNSNSPNSDTNFSEVLNDGDAIQAPAVKPISVNGDAMKDLVILPTAPLAEDLTQMADNDAMIHPLKPPAAFAMRYQLLTSDDLCKLPTFEWRIKGVLPALGLAVLFGPSGSGKSFLVLDMLQSLALGHDWFGHKVKQCSLTYVALEGETGVANRIKAYLSRHGSTPMDIRYVTQPFNLLDSDDIYALATAILAAGTGDVVVLDTLSRATPGSDENDSKDMGKIVSAAKVLQELVGGLVLLIHHTGKVQANGMRGHSSLHAALDCAIEVKRKGDQREWIVAKSKDGEDGATHSFKLEVVSLGIDSDGDPITSCVIVENQSSQAIGKKSPTLGKNQAIALKALEQPLTNAFEIGKDGEPQGKPCLLFQQALEIVAPLMPGEAKHKKQRAKEAISGLVSNKVMEMDGDRLWLN